MSAQRKARLADAAVNTRRGGQLRVVLGPKTVGATTGFLGVLDLAPGEFVSEHYHPYSEEFVYVVSGSMTVRMDGEPVELAAQEGVLVPIDVRHRVENNTDQPAQAVFHLAPLAPEPRLGHVDTEELVNPSAPHVEVSEQR